MAYGAGIDASVSLGVHVVYAHIVDSPSDNESFAREKWPLRARKYMKEAPPYLFHVLSGK
jgi:hypothetical protein